MSLLDRNLSVPVLTLFPFVSLSSRTFCFPGVSGLYTVNTRQYHTSCPLRTETVLSYPQSNIHHARVQLRLALTAA